VRATDVTTDQFDRIKAVYPPRAGDYRWQGARKSINAALADGAEFDAIMAGTQRYSDYAHAVGWIDTERVKQAETFYRQRGWAEEWCKPKVTANGSRPTRFEENQARLQASLEAVESAPTNPLLEGMTL